MIFHVEQDGLFSFGLLWEYGRVLGRSRRRTLLGKLLLFPGAWVLFMGVTFTVGMVSVAWEPLTPDEELGMLVMVPLTLVLLLWGLSWCGISRLPAALFRLEKLRRAQMDARFYPNRLEEAGSSFRTEYPYQSVWNVYEGRRAFFLCLETHRLIILPKKCFTLGEPDAFRRFMDEKCGKPVNML